MTPSKRIALLLALVVGGCGMFRSGDDGKLDGTVTTRPATTQQSWNSSTPLPQALQPVNRPVVQDPLPLIWLVDDDGTYRVTNVESGEEIATFAAKQSQIIRVESKGVLLANAPVIGATLAPGTYAISKVPDSAMGTLEVTQRVGHPMPAAATKPASRPATPPPAAHSKPAQPTAPPAPSSPSSPAPAAPANPPRLMPQPIMSPASTPPAATPPPPSTPASTPDNSTPPPQ